MHNGATNHHSTTYGNCKIFALEHLHALSPKHNGAGGAKRRAMMMPALGCGRLGTCGMHKAHVWCVSKAAMRFTC
jgi:hypothetical protein